MSLNRKKVYCNCSKCRKNDTVSGLLVSKSTRTRHRKREKDQTSNSSLEDSSSLTISELEESSSNELFETKYISRYVQL